MTDDILEQALKQYWAAQAVLDKEGYLVVDKWGNHKTHPAVGWQKIAFDQVHKLVKLKGGADAEDTIDDLLATGSSD
jgi:phage terminase small subunit